MASHGAADSKCPGTSLADQLSVPPGISPTGLRVATADVVWRNQRDRMFLAEARNTSLSVLGLGIIVQLLVFGIFWHAGYERWRICTLVGWYVAFMLSHRAIISITRESGRVASAFILMNVSAQLFVVGSAALTGGVHSPFMPGTALPAIVSLLFFGPQAVSRWIALGNALLLIAMVFLPSELVGPSLPSAHYATAIVIALAWNIFMLHMLVGKLSVVASRTSESMACLREERLGDAEAQLRRLQSVGAKVAHELKNPLASIKGLCQLVARTPESERTQERLAVVHSEIARMETILAEYLSFSRPLEDIVPEPIELGRLARDVLDVLDGRAQGAGVELSIEGSAPAVTGDPRRLKEALINIIANAIEATPQGGKVALELRSHSSAGGGGNVVLSVRDTGRGITPEDLEKLGNPFFTTRANGTGLGVVLAQGVITQHGGSLGYVSTVGKGTTATITLPLTRPTVEREPVAVLPAVARAPVGA